MKVDGVTDVSEAITLYEINNYIKLSVNESDESLKMTFEDSKEIINSMDKLKKKITKDYFYHMANTDGLFDKLEQDMINEIFG